MTIHRKYLKHRILTKCILMDKLNSSFEQTEQGGKEHEKKVQNLSYFILILLILQNNKLSYKVSLKKTIKTPLKKKKNLQWNTFEFQEFS